MAGFTVVELLVVVVIFGLLAMLVVPRYFDFSQIRKSNVNIARTQIDMLSKALDKYRLDVGTYPSTEQGLDALFAKPDGVDHWQGPYLQKQAPQDPWGRPYRYQAPGEHGEFDLSTYGADGRPGGVGENLDVTSWDVVAPDKPK